MSERSNTSFQRTLRAVSDNVGITLNYRQRLFALIFLVVFSGIQLGCSNPAWHTVYQDEEKGYSIGLPIGWTPVPSNFVSEFELDADGSLRDDPRDYTRQDIETALSNTTVVAIFSPHDWTSARPRFPMLSVAIESGQGSQTVPDYLTEIGDYLSTSFDHVGDLGTMRCGGTRFDYLQFETRVDQAFFYADLYCTRHGDYMLSFHSIAFRQEELDLMRSMVCSSILVEPVSPVPVLTPHSSGPSPAAGSVR